MSQPALVNSSDISCTAALPRPCPVCKSRQSAPLRRLQLVVPEDFALQHAFTINACEGCGAVFHDIRHQPDRESYYESYTGSATQDYKVSPDQARLNDLTLHFLEAAGLKPGHAAIADVGCSFGITLLALQQKGFENLYAIDPDRAAIRYLAAQGISGRTGMATEALAELEGRFDLIILRHVLEHLESPLDAVQNLIRWLKPEGRLYVELPDLARFQECAPFPGFFFEFEHINHLSLVSLLNLMRGFTLRNYESTPELYPCMRALFERSHAEGPLCYANRDAQYLEESFTLPSEQGRGVLSRVADLGTREIALWGVSVFVYRMLTHTPLGQCHIRHLVDGNPQRQGERLLGLPVEAPDVLRSFQGDIVICGENSADSIERAIRSMGLKNPVIRLVQTPTKNAFR